MRVTIIIFLFSIIQFGLSFRLSPNGYLWRHFDEEILVPNHEISLDSMKIALIETLPRIESATIGKYIVQFDNITLITLHTIILQDIEI